MNTFRLIIESNHQSVQYAKFLDKNPIVAYNPHLENSATEVTKLQKNSQK